MTTLPAAQNAQKATLASLIELILADQTLPEARRREMASAVRTVAKVLRQEPHMIPAAPADLRDQINEALPLAAGVTGQRWKNAKSLLRKSLAMLDPQVIPARSRAGLLPEWSALIKELQEVSLLRGLARFSKWCSCRDIAPADVNQAAYEAFYEDLAAHCVMRSPRETQQTAGKAWNVAVATVPGWPQQTLEIACFRRNPSLPWDAYPASLAADIEAYLTPRASKRFNLRNRAPRLRAATIQHQRVSLRVFLSALVESGRDPATLLTLADIVDPDTAWAGLNILVDRADGETTTRIYGIAYLLLSIAKHWAKAGEATISELKEIVKEMRPPKGGMTEKNRLRLQQFDDPKVLGSLLNLPAQIMAEACNHKIPTKVEARAAQLAVATEILLMAPIRIKNLSELEIGRTLFLKGRVMGHILIAANEVKNSVLIEIPLPASALKLIDVYLTKFYGLLAPPGCRMLFPSLDGGHKRSSVLSHQMSTYVAKRCGAKTNPHLYRHLAAKLWLEAFPGAYGVVRMLLGHKNLKTTTDSYCGTEFKAAFIQYDQLLQKVRGSPNTRTPEPRFREVRR